LTIIDNTSKIIKIIRQTEIDEVQRRNLKSVQDPKIVDNEFNVSIDIPGYAHMIQGDKFIWLKKEVVAEHEFVNLPGFT
jgi:hypothetical protein